jgi:hypothetical protein
MKLTLEILGALTLVLVTVGGLGFYLFARLFDNISTL